MYIQVHGCSVSRITICFLPHNSFIKVSKLWQQEGVKHIKPTLCAISNFSCAMRYFIFPPRGSHCCLTAARRARSSLAVSVETALMTKLMLAMVPFTLWKKVDSCSWEDYGKKELHQYDVIEFPMHMHESGSTCAHMCLFVHVNTCTNYKVVAWICMYMYVIVFTPCSNTIHCTS